MDIFIALAAKDPNLPYLGICSHGGDPDWGQAALRSREDVPGKRDGSQICQRADTDLGSVDRMLCLGL